MKIVRLQAIDRIKEYTLSTLEGGRTNKTTVNETSQRQDSNPSPPVLEAASLPTVAQLLYPYHWCQN